MIKAADSTKLVVYFDFNKYEIKQAEQFKLDSFIKVYDTSIYNLNQFLIFGHTDQIGNNNYNDSLSKKRAQKIAVYLLSKSIQSNVIEPIKGFGKRQLITAALDDKERYLNRRVVITLLYTKKTKPVAIPNSATIKEPVYAGRSSEPIVKSQKLSDKINDSTTRVGDKIELPYILFVGGMHEFLQISYPYLDELFYVMRDNPTLEIEIQGHVCCTNEDDGIDLSTGRKNLSYARAREVYYFLKKSGIDAKRMTYKGLGHQFPITQERNEAEKTRNRRVEIQIINK